MIPEPVIGCSILGPDGGGLYFDYAPRGILCSQCNQCLDDSYVPSRIKATKTNRYDVWATYDNRIIVSDRFRRFCEESGFLGCTFRQIGDGKFYVLWVLNSTAHFDRDRAPLEYGDECSSCGRYEFVVGAIPTFIVESELADDRFYATDMRFGAGLELSPQFIVGSELANRLRGERFKDLTLLDVHSTGAIST